MNLKLNQYIDSIDHAEDLYQEINDIFISAQSEAYALQQQISSIEMLYSVAQHIRKFGITEENCALFAVSFEQAGITYNYEGIISTAYNSVKNVIEKIIKFLKEKAQAFFRKLKEWYNRIFRKKVQEAAKTPFPKEKADEFNKEMSENSKSSSNESASFTELANHIDLQSDMGGNRFVYLDDVTKSLSLGLPMLKRAVNDFANNKSPNPSESVSFRFGTAYEGGWSDPEKIDKFMSILNDMSDTIGDVAVDLNRLARRIDKGELQLSESVIEEIKDFGSFLPKMMVYTRIGIKLAKKAIEIRESIIKGQIPD